MKTNRNRADNNKNSTSELVGRVVKNYLAPYKGRLFVALFFMVVASGMTAAFAKLIEPVLDKVLVAQNEALILPLSFGVLAIFVINGVSSYIHTIIMNMMGQSIVADIQKDLFGRFMDLDLVFFHKNPSGQLISRIINDVNAMRTALADSLTGIGKSLVTLIFLITIMFTQDAKLAFFVCFVFPVAALFVSYIGRRLRKVSIKIQNEVGNLSDTLSQVFQGIRQVKAYNREQYEKDRSSSIIDKVRDHFFKGIKVGNLSTPLNETLLGFALMGVIAYGGFEVTKNQLTVGGLMSFIAAFSLSYEPLKRLARLNNNLQMGLGAAERVFEMMDNEPAITSPVNPKPFKPDVPEIKFETVTFGYNEDDSYALNGADFTLPAGKVTALVGASGSGKTTAMNMVPRFYDAQEGRVLIDGVDVRDVSLGNLRDHIALVSQDITIFDDTVATNIRYGRLDATDKEIEQAADAAAASLFIKDLPAGYDTRLGENGVALSGGQRQRIAIARAVLKDAPILLLDEATSALDNESEKLIQKSLAKLQDGRTTLVIAHRLTTVQNAGQIIVLDKGRVAERGKHDELMRAKGIYAKMYEMGLDN